MPYYAHSNGSDKSSWQSLKDHLINTSQLALILGADSGIAPFASIAALLHDIGKYSQTFQDKLTGAQIKVDHSTAGAQEAVTIFNKNPNQQLMAILLAYCIAGHHSGLPDYGSVIDCESDGTLQARFKKQVADYKDYAREVDPSKLVLPDHIPIKPIRNNPGFSLAFFTRMVYSILVDADFLETETFMNGGVKPRGGYADIDALCFKFNQFLRGFENPANPIDQQRTNTLNVCIGKANEKPGMFTLTVPTGGGKTFASLAFALNHAVVNGLKRVIYVIPYTSIIEQNAAEFKRCLGDDNVLEHHSNFDWGWKDHRNEIEFFDDKTNNALEKLRLAAENWDIPIVMTTNVQFFESLYANRSSRCRKLHNIARSVMIFDEAQMLPREYLKPCLFAVHELVNNYGATAVFCTATQPAVEQFLPQGAELKELAPNPQKLYNFFKRVRVKSIGKISDEDLICQINQYKQVLCIVNTRKHARGLFAGVSNDGRFHLSTLMCPMHRKQTITAIRERLQEGQICRVVSTQIMEAGIDVDFPVGYRALSGMDSIIQAAGRVNREGKQASGEVFVFEPNSAFVKRTPGYIQQAALVTLKVLRRHTDDPVCIQAIEVYYNDLYDLQDKRAFDAQGILGCFEKGTGELNFDFETAAGKFKVIEDNKVPVLVPFDKKAVEILQEVKASRYPWSYSKKLQAYTVSVYESEFLAMQNMGLIDIYCEYYSVLNDMDYYDAETGLKIPESAGGEALFFDG